MVGLRDIGPVSAVVTIRGQEISVVGISALGLFKLIDQFPEFRKLLSGAGVKITPTDLLAQIPGAVSTIIAAVVGMPDDADTIKIASTLTLGEQAELIRTAWDLTFPTGVKAFTEALDAVVALTGPTWAPATASPGPSSNS